MQRSPPMSRSVAVSVIDNLREKYKDKSLSAMDDDEQRTFLRAWYAAHGHDNLFTIKLDSGAPRRVADAPLPTILYDLVGRYGTNVLGYEKRVIKEIEKNVRFVQAISKLRIPVQDPLAALHTEEPYPVFGADIKVRNETYAKQPLIEHMKSIIGNVAESEYFIPSTPYNIFLRDKEIHEILMQDTKRLNELQQSFEGTKEEKAEKARLRFSAEVENLVKTNRDRRKKL